MNLAFRSFRLMQQRGTEWLLGATKRPFEFSASSAEPDPAQCPIAIGRLEVISEQLPHSSRRREQHAMKIASFTAGLALAVTLSVLLFAFDPSPGWAEDELQKELVPGLDMWSEERRAAPDWESKETVPDLLPRAKRHRKFMEAGVPLEYRGSGNPYPQARMIIDDGGRLYMLHCASCHGAKGFGNGEAGRDLTPPPAFLAYLIKRREAVDEYLLWTISEGGAQFGSEMPAFKETLTDQEIWQIITYMRADFPDVGETGQD